MAQLNPCMHNGQLYNNNNPELFRAQMECRALIHQYNQMDPRDTEQQQAVFSRIFAEVGEHCYFEPPFNANWGCFTHLGKYVYANFNLTLVDDTHIYLGDHVMIGPNVTICTATHPIHPGLRRQAAQYNKPVHIGNNVWIGAGSTILPGVTIGENSVIGAGSLVNQDIPANVVAYGTPCRVVRPIQPEDLETYDHGKAIDFFPVGKRIKATPPPPFGVKDAGLPKDKTAPQAGLPVNSGTVPFAAPL